MFFLLIISRPAFGRLCGRVVGLSVRFCLRRFVALIVTVIDSVLDEIILQTETALLLESPPYVRPENGAQPQVVVATTNHVWHLLCILIGGFLGRLFPRPS